MKLKTSITILGGCLLIFLFIMLPIVLSIQDKKEDIVASYAGSAFTLTDINNDPITEKSFQGPLTAIFFGFTNCPDVCPMTLTNLDLVIEKLNDSETKKLKVFFVSIDPERDSPQIIKDYLDSFKNKIYGITGDPKKVFLLSKSWGVLSEKIFNEDGSYLINHSSSILLLDRGKYIDRISHHETMDNIFKIIKNYL
ncbi:SCO family protein [Pelagibacterales bacterium SAG-MED20]|nr:SCO family protein [Pelagibacterales bacterium SAG-MED20]